PQGSARCPEAGRQPRRGEPERAWLHGERGRFVHAIELPVDDADGGAECVQLGGKREPGRARPALEAACACRSLRWIRMTRVRIALCESMLGILVPDEPAPASPRRVTRAVAMLWLPLSARHRYPWRGRDVLAGLGAVR